MPCRSGLTILLLLVFANGSSALGQAGGSRGTSSKSRANEAGKAFKPRPAKSPKSTFMTPAREAAALTFARLHHPELADLLEGLKKQNQPAYDRAVRQLFLASERLARIKERWRDHYRLELDTWKLESRIQLLAARMTMSGDSALEAELKSALLQRLDMRVERLKAERQRLTARLQKIDETIKKIERDPDQAALRDLERMKKNLRAFQPKSRKSGKGKTRKPGGPPNSKQRPKQSKPGKKPTVR